MDVIRNRRMVKGKRGTMKKSSSIVAAACLVAASSSFLSVQAGSVVAGGMATHVLDSQTASVHASAAAGASPSFAAFNNADSQAVISALANNGSSNPDLVSQAVSEAGTASPTASSFSGSASASVRSSISLTASGSSSSSGAARSAVTSSSSASASARKDDARTYSVKASAQPQATTWAWAAGAFGCPSGSKPSGTAQLCYATGSGSASVSSSPVPNTSAATTVVESKANKSDRRRGLEQQEFEYVWNAKRQASSSTNNDDSNNMSGNGGPPLDINNLNSPDIGWLDTVVGGVPYKNGDLAASIVWIIATLMLMPLFLIRLLRRSSLIAHVLFTVFLFGCVMIAAFGIRAYLANQTPTTTLMNVENILLQILPPLLLEPLLNLLALYASQGGFPTGVPRVALFLRFLNLTSLILYAVTAAYTAVYLSKWDKALTDNSAFGDRDQFPPTDPQNIIRLGPIIGAFIELVAIAGGLLLIPIARGENGSARPGGFLAVLFLLLAISVIYRVLQTIHAQSQLNKEDGGDPNPFGQLYSGTSATMSSAAMNAVMRLVQVGSIAPPGMYSPNDSGIAWSQLQQTMASRGVPQTPVIFNLVYVLPLWLETFLLFFVHAPGHHHDGKLAAASTQP